MNRVLRRIFAVLALVVCSLALGVLIRSLTNPEKPGTNQSEEATGNSSGAENSADVEQAQAAESAQVSLQESDVREEENTGAESSDSQSSPEESKEDSADSVAYTEFISTDTAFYTYEQMMKDLEKLAVSFSDLITLHTCGVSLDGRNIPEAVIGNPASSTHILIQASIHAREYVNTLLAMKQIENLLIHHDDGIYDGLSYNELLSDVCIHVLPMSNPDGVTISQFGIQGIRDEGLKEILMRCYENDLANGRASQDMDSYWKTWKANARGVDLNRNFDAGWETYEGVAYPSSDHYKGTSPVSEPETLAIVNAVHSCNAVITISYHSTGSVIYWDYGSSGEIYEKDSALAGYVSSITGYECVSSVQSSQDAAGCSDYFVLKENIPSITIENGYNSCPIGIEEFPTIWASNVELLPALASAYR